MWRHSFPGRGYATETTMACLDCGAKVTVRRG